MSEHVKRGAELHRDRPVGYDMLEEEAIYGVWHCTECDDKLELRQRRGYHAYTEIGCSCGAVSLDLRIADILDIDVDLWETEAPEDTIEWGADDVE